MAREDSGGYYADWTGIRRRGEHAREEAEYVAAVRDELRAVFAAEGDPLGDDQYGAEFAKTFPARRDEIFDLFKAYIDDIDGLRDGLVNGAKRYETAEHASLSAAQRAAGDL